MAAGQAPSTPSPVLVTSVGARTTLGLSALHAAMLMRARRGDPRSLSQKDKRGHRIGACRSPGLPVDLHGCDRLVALAAPALRAAIPADSPPSEWAVLLAVAEPGRPDDDARLGGSLLGEIAEASGISLDERRSRTIRAGHAGTAVAMAAAMEEIAAGAKAVIVGGVDSYFHPEVLAWLDAECRLHALGAENGFVPGEGAGFLVLSASPGASGRPPVQLRRALAGYEESAITDAPNVAEAMTAILHDLASHSPGGQLPWSLTDVNGERHRVREWRLAAGRGAFAERALHQRPTDDLGDLGAASGAVFAAIACELFRTGAAPAASVCVALASEARERGAFLMSSEVTGPASTPEGSRPRARDTAGKELGR
ncbi:MAG: beta-ketoacyl synthase N-terminal-like domain-containing protein [Polyangiaceae bacterium]